MIKTCTCKHDLQDRVHGAGRRVHTRIGAANKPAKGWRCTVCAQEKTSDKK